MIKVSQWLTPLKELLKPFTNIRNLFDLLKKEKFSPTTFGLQVAKTRIMSFTFQLSLRLNLPFKQMRLQGSFTSFPRM